MATLGGKRPYLTQRANRACLVMSPPRSPHLNTSYYSKCWLTKAPVSQGENRVQTQCPSLVSFARSLTGSLLEPQWDLPTCCLHARVTRLNPASGNDWTTQGMKDPLSPVWLVPPISTYGWAGLSAHFSSSVWWSSLPYHAVYRLWRARLGQPNKASHHTSPSLQPFSVCCNSFTNFAMTCKVMK